MIDAKGNQTGAKQAQSPLIPSAVTSMVQGAIKAAVVSSNVTKRNKTVSSQQPKVEQSSNAQKIYGAALNLKVEQSKVLEQKIKELRAMNTQEAREAADIIEEEMKKLCESDLSKLDIQKIEEKVLTYTVNKVTEKMREPGDAIISATTGFVTSIAFGTLGAIGGTLEGAWSWITTGDFGRGYTKFNEEIVQPLKQQYEEWVPNKDTYKGGQIVGDAFQLVYGIKGMISGAQKIVKGINMVVQGGNPSINIDGGVGAIIQDISGMRVLAQEVEAVVGIYGEAVAESTALFSGGANDFDNLKNTTGGSGDMPKEIYNSIKESPNYPEGFVEKQNGTVKNKMDNNQLLENLRKIEKGDWKKVYKDGYDISGNKISIHYFQSKSGKVFNVKIKPYWSNGGGK